MNPDDIELHDAILNSVAMNFNDKIVELCILYYPSESHRQRVQLKILIRNIQYFNQVSDLDCMEKNRSAGNVSYWHPGTLDSPTFIYLSDGCLVIKGATPEVS